MANFLMPTVLKLCYHKFFGVKKDNHKVFFKGIYQNFEELKQGLGSLNQYYWPMAVEQEFAQQKERMSGKLSNSPVQGNYRTNFLPTLLSMFPREKIRVLDIGGGLNNSYEYLKYSIKKEIHVTVFDQSPTVKNGMKLYFENSEIKFTDRLPMAGEYFDVVYFGSSLQYFSDFRSLMHEISKLNPVLIVVTDSSFGVVKSFACKQINMPDVEIPYMVINRDEFELVSEECGYKCIHQSINLDAIQNFENYQQPYNLTKSFNFVLQKVT